MATGIKIVDVVIPGGIGGGGGGEGTSNYNDLINKPRINNTELGGNKTAAQLGLLAEPADEGTNGQVLTTDGNGGRSWTTVQGGGGTSDYNGLSNKPSIGGIILTGNKTLTDIGAQAAIPDLATIRSGAALGATALQSVPEGYATTAQLTALAEEVDGKADKTVVATSQPVGGILPDTLYNLGTLGGSVTFSLAAAVSGNVNHYFWTFSTGATAPTITWPNGITWQGGSAPTINASKHYEISILNNYGVAMEV